MTLTTNTTMTDRACAWCASRRVGVGLGLGLLALLLLTIVGSVLAEDRSRGITPREVATAPDFSGAVPSGPGPAEHTRRRWMDVSELSAHLGRPVLLPAPGALPQGCEPQERFTMEGIRAVTVLYACVGLVQWAGANGASPAVAPGSTQSVIVAGQPGLFIDGTWQQGPDGARSWQRGDVKLVFERDGVLFELRGYGGNLGVPDEQGRSASIPNVWHLGREDLIRIAESLAPAP